ncbi:uncharacterized protein LOC106872863 isoform X1 [Octopus bimaculoides]|nr:uncharacterized protein LOC106872863 isoform X1 [Octopus bimaculoides]
MRKNVLTLIGPLDNEFSYEPPGKKSRSFLAPKSDIRRAQFKGSKSMPPIDTSSPGPITQPIKDAEESPFLTSMLSSSTDRPVDSYNLPLKYLLQVTDSELQNMSRQVPTSQKMSMAGDGTAITQLVLRPVSSGQSNVLQDNVILSDIIKMPVSERGIEKYQLKPDTIESQGFKPVYTKQQCDQYESNPVSYSNFKSRTFKSQQPQSGEKFRQQISGDNTVGRKRKLPTKPGRHICHFCGLGCAKPSVLEKHIRSHTGERPYPCVACGVFFKTKSNLYKHNKSRAHAVKAGLGQIPTSTSSEMTSTEGEGDNEDANESEETQTETSDTDGENEEKQMKHCLLDPSRLKRGYSESDAKIRIEEFQEKKSTSLTENCFLGDQHQSVNVTKMTSCGSSNTTNTVASVNIHGEISKGSSLELHTDSPLHHSGNLDGKTKLSVSSMTGHTPVYLPDKCFYDVPQISKLPETNLNEESKEDILVPVADNVVSGSLQSSHAKESFNLHDKQTVSSKDHVPLSLSLQTSHSKSQDKSIHPINKSSEETKTISSLSITGSTPTDKKRLEEHILQIISKNDTIVNTPMSEPPRQKRIFRQHSDQPNTSGSKLEELPQSVSMTKVSIPSILSIPLAPIPDDNDINKDLCLSPQSYFTPLISEKKEISNPKLPELLSSSSKTENLNEKLSSTNICSGLQGSQEIKIEIKLPKTGSNVVTIATPSQSIIGKPNMQFSPTSVVTTVVSSSSFVKNPENSVIKGLLLKGKTSSLTSPTPPSRVIKEKSSSVDEITTMRNESTLISFQREDIGTYSVSNVSSVYSKASQLQKFRHSKSSSSSTSMDSHTSPITITERRPDRPALVKCSSFEKDVPPGYLSHSFSSDRESSVDVDLEKGERLKDDKHDSNAVVFNTENYDLVAPKKKGRPKGSKNKPKMMNATVSVQGLSSTTLATSSSSSQNSILLATLKQPSLQQPYTEPSCDLPPWKVILKNKLIKRSMSTERMLSQEKDSDSFSAQSTISTSPSTESSSSLGPVRASSFEMLKQPIDNERNERNSPLKKRKVPNEFLQSDPISRPGVTRAGSEPLMSQMGLNAASSKSLSEKRLSSLPETLEYKYSVPQVTNSLNNPVCSGPVTVPVVVAQPIVIPMKFSDSIQSAIPAHVPVTSGWSKLNKVALSTHCDIQLSLPAIPATSTSSKQILQLPLVTSLVVSKFPKDNKIEATNLTEEFPLLNTSKELSTSVSNSTDIVSVSETYTQPDVTSIVVPVSACPASLLSGDSTLTSLKEVSTVSTTGCNTSKQQITTSLRSLTQTTFCCVQRLQPMYVPQGENQKISMYSNWRVSKHTPHPSNLTPQMSLFLYNSKNTSDPIYSVAKYKSETNVTESSEWNLYSKRKLLPLSSSVVEKLSNGVLTIDTTVATEVVKLPTDIMISDKKDIGLLPQSENKVDSLLTSSSSKETVTTKEPKRVRIFQGGFRSTEEYTYIRGRGRGKYVCEECGIRCKKPSMLKKHIRTHTDLRPYHCRHCRFSFKTKGNLTKHMKSKAHQKKCLELGIDPVPIIVDESQIDSEALAAQSAIAKETKSLDDENEDDEEDDDDIDDEEETDDADGQFSDSEESARTSFERMDTNETVDTSIDRESECGMPTHSSSLDVAETSRISEVNSYEVSESEHASGSEIAVSMTSVYVGTSGLTATISSSSVAMITGVANQSQIDNEIARSLLDLSQRQVQPSEDAAKEISTNVASHTKTDTSEKTLVRQYSFDMADSPERGMSRSPSQTEHPEIQVFSADECEKFPSSVSVREKEENIVIVQRETSPISHERKDSKRQQSSEKEETNLSNSQALMALKTTKGPTHCLPSGVSVDPVLSEPSSTQKIIFVSEIPQSLQTIVANDTGQTSISTVSLSFTGILPNGSMGPLVGQVLQGSSSTTLNSTNTTITLSPLIPPFQFQHPFQAFERSTEIKPEETNVKLKEDTSSTVIIPLVDTSGENQSPICNPKTVLLPQTSCVQTANSVATSIIHDSDSNNQLQPQPLIGQVVLPNQQTPNNSSLVSIIVTNQAYQTTDGLSPQNQNKPENGFQSVYQRIQSPPQQHSNSESHISESRHIERSSPSKLGSNMQVNNMAAIKPSNYISEGSHQPLAVFTPTKIVGQKLHSEQQSSTFERHSPVMFVDDIQRRNLYEQKQIAEQQTSFKIQPSTMISNVQIPVHHISRQSPKTHVEKSFSPTLFADNYSTTRQHQTDLSASTQPQLEEFFPVHQNSDNFSSIQQHQRERYSPMRQPNMEQYSAPQNQVNTYSPNQQLNMDRYPKTQQQMERYSPTQPLNADKYSPTKQINMDKYSTTQLKLERYPATQQQKMKHYNPVHQSNVERYSPTRQLHVDRYSTVQHVDRYSLSQQHADLLPSQNYVERVSPYHPLERLSSPRHHRQLGDRISPTRHVNRLSPTRQHVSRLSPTHHVDRFSPTWQYTDKLSPTQQGVERLSPSRQHSERLSPSRQFLTRFSPTRQTNRMSQNVDLVSNPKPHVDMSLECQSPTRQIIRMSPQPFSDKISGTAQINRVPNKSNETSGQIPLEPSSSNLSEQQSTDRSIPESTIEKVIIEKHLSYRHLEPQVSSKIFGCNATSKPNETLCVEKQHVVTSISTSCSQTMQKSFKEDLNRCRDCNKKFSTSQDYTVHRRQHMKTHRSEDATTSHTRPHLHKCFHSEGHADSRSLSTEEIPKPPDCVNCKVDFWKQNHLPKHLWAKTHKMTLEKLRNKHSSSSDSEPANLADSVSETISHSTSAVTVVAPSRVETIPASEKALDLSRDESLTVTQTSIAKTSSLITTASVTNAANIQSVSVSSEPTFRLSEENKITGLETPSQPQLLLHQRPHYQNYLEPYSDSSIKIKDEPLESDKWSSVQNHQWLRVTNSSTEMTGTGIIPVMSVMAVTSPNMCNLCQAAFPSHHQLQSHILVHKNHRPYVCDYCDAGFTKKQSLKIHLQTHSLDKPYICDICGDTFASADKRSDHYQIHSEAHHRGEDSITPAYQQLHQVVSPLPKAYTSSQELYMTLTQLPGNQTPLSETSAMVQQKHVPFRTHLHQDQQYLEIRSPNVVESTAVTVSAPILTTAISPDSSSISKP